MNNKNKIIHEFPSAVLAVFARDPELGKVKTRLQPVLGPARALELHEMLIRYVFGTLQESNVCPVELWMARETGVSEPPKEHHELSLSICNKSKIHTQFGSDLGAKMQHAANTILARAECVVLVGADCPSVDAGYLRSALNLLSNDVPVVIGPADDGGYVLLGLRKAPEFLFSDVPWGTDKVLEVTRENLRRHNVHWIELEPRWDVDRPEDLPKLATLAPPLRF